MTRKKQQAKHARLAKKIEKTRIEKKRLKVFACKRCFVKFSNNIKFYQHVQNHYQKRFAISFAKKLAKSMFTSFFNESILFAKKLAKIQIFFTLSIIFITFAIFEIFNSIEFCLFATSFAISKKQIF